MAEPLDTIKASVRENSRMVPNRGSKMPMTAAPKQFPPEPNGGNLVNKASPSVQDNTRGSDAMHAAMAKKMMMQRIKK